MIGVFWFPATARAVFEDRQQFYALLSDGEHRLSLPAGQRLLKPRDLDSRLPGFESTFLDAFKALTKGRHPRRNGMSLKLKPSSALTDLVGPCDSASLARVSRYGLMDNQATTATAPYYRISVRPHSHCSPRYGLLTVPTLR